MTTPPDPALLGPDDCWTCQTARLAYVPWPHNMSARMILCPDCGNKRCPKAGHHDNPCSGSNEPGQPGSAYPPVDLTPPSSADELRATILARGTPARIAGICSECGASLNSCRLRFLAPTLLGPCCEQCGHGEGTA